MQKWVHYDFIQRYFRNLNGEGLLLNIVLSRSASAGGFSSVTAYI